MEPIIQRICFIKAYTSLFFRNRGEPFKLIKGDNFHERWMWLSTLIIQPFDDVCVPNQNNTSAKLWTGRDLLRFTLIFICFQL